MNTRRIRLAACYAIIVVAMTALTRAAAAQPAVVDFESVPVGTRYGGVFGHAPGQVVLSQNGINMSVHQFRFDTFVDFHVAEVGGPHDDMFPTTPLYLNNISVQFDFAGVGFGVTEVTLDYIDFGVSDNFAVNGASLFQLDALTDLPAAVAPGVTAAVLTDDEIRLVGPINNFLIGGSELGIDNIRAVPEPTTGILILCGATALLRRSRRS